MVERARECVLDGRCVFDCDVVHNTNEDREAQLFARLVVVDERTEDTTGRIDWMTVVILW